jgi:hypothetical protein
LPPAPRSVSLPSPPWTTSAAAWPVKVSSPGPRSVVPVGTPVAIVTVSAPPPVLSW